MKRVVVLVVIIAIMTSLFSFSVYAAPAMGYSTSASISSADNNITAYMYAVYEEELDPVDSYPNNYVPVLNISIRIVNNTDKWVIKDTDQFKIRINGVTSVSLTTSTI